jgi:hypothetical protein
MSAPKIKTDPYGEDKLGRDRDAGILTNLVSHITDPYVLAIDAPWGTGKTTFLTEIWKPSLEKEGFRVVYYNAWENDFAQEPFVSLMGELMTAFSEEGDEVEAVNDGAKKVMKVLAKRGLPILLKILTRGAIDENELAGLNLAAAGVDATEDLLDSYKTDKETLAEFKKQFAALVAKKTEPGDGNERKPLIVMIDELDRCRPPFAIELLEKVKHLFSVPHVIFVLGVDKGQLGHSVRTLYGNDMDADGYLRRFIDMEYRLEITEDHGLSEYLMKKYKIEEAVMRIKPGSFIYQSNPFHWQLKWLFGGLSDIWGLSVRDREKLAIQLQLCILSMGQLTAHPFLVGVVLALRLHDESLYLRLTRREMSFGELADSLKEKIEWKQNPSNRNLLADECGDVAGHLGSIKTVDLTRREVEIAWDKWRETVQGIEANKVRSVDDHILVGMNGMKTYHERGLCDKENVLKLSANIGKFAV